MNEFEPDLGTFLMGTGAQPDTDLTFNAVHVAQLGTPDGALFCSTSCASMEGRQYALTLDMDRGRLDEFIMACPGDAAQHIINALMEKQMQSWSMELPEPAVIDVIGRLGEVQHGKRETFIPLVVRKIKPALAPSPLAAAAALIALGREVAPFMDGTESDEDRLGALRSRIVEIGQILDGRGGLELMRNVYKGATRFLADEDVHVGRWIESVWSGIGSWQG